MSRSFFCILLVLFSIICCTQANQAKKGFWNSWFSKGKSSNADITASSTEITSPHHDESSLKAGIAKFYDQVSLVIRLLNCCF